MPRSGDSGFDGAVVDRDNQTVALVEVKIGPVGERWDTVLPNQLARYAERVDFVLAIDPVNIRLYRLDAGRLGEPVAVLDTARVLEHNDPDFPNKRIFESYLLTLVEAWLRDLAYHWKSLHPPGFEELREAGLLDRIEGGTTERLGD